MWTFIIYYVLQWNFLTQLFEILLWVWDLIANISTVRPESVRPGKPNWQHNSQSRHKYRYFYGTLPTAASALHTTLSFWSVRGISSVAMDADAVQFLFQEMSVALWDVWMSLTRSSRHLQPTCSGKLHTTGCFVEYNACNVLHAVTAILSYTKNKYSGPDFMKHCVQ